MHLGTRKYQNSFWNFSVVDQKTSAYLNTPTVNVTLILILITNVIYRCTKLFRCHANVIYLSPIQLASKRHERLEIAKKRNIWSEAWIPWAEKREGFPVPLVIFPSLQFRVIRRNNEADTCWHTANNVSVCHWNTIGTSLCQYRIFPQNSHQVSTRIRSTQKLQEKLPISSSVVLNAIAAEKTFSRRASDLWNRLR